MKRALRFRLTATVFLVLFLVAPARATEQASNGWRVKKYSRELWTACGLVVRYFVEVQRTGPALDGTVSFGDYRSPAYSEKYLNDFVFSHPQLVIQGGDSNGTLYLLTFAGVPQGQTYVIQYDVQMKTPLSPGQRVRNRFVAGSGRGPENELALFYDVWVKLANGHGRSQAARVGEPVDAATGEFVLPPETDFDLGGPLPLRFTRWYGSALNDPWFNHVDSALGRNWMHNFDVMQTWAGGTDTRFVVHEDGKIVDFTRLDYTFPTPSNAWARNFEQEPVPFEFKSDGDATGTNFWFLDPARELLYRFDGALTSCAKEILDRNGNALQIRRRTDGLVTNVSDGLGRQLEFEYNAASNLVRVTDGTRSVSFGQDANGFLVAATNALGETVRYAYDPTNSFLNGNQALMVSVEYPRGNVPYVQTYDSNGMVVAQADAYGNNSTFEYGADGENRTRVTDPEGVLEPSHYDGRLLTNFTDQAGHSFSRSYDGRDLPTRFIDRRGFQSRLIYPVDAHRPVLFVDPLGRTTSYSYVWTTQTFTNAEFPARTVQFAFQDLFRIYHPDGTVERFDRDGRGNVTSYVDRAGAAWSIAYNERGQIVAIERPEGGTETFAYNADGTLASAADSDTDPAAFAYDDFRRRISAAYPGGRVESWAYDALDRVVAATNGYGAASAFEYDANGILVRARDPAGFETARQTDPLDRATNSTDSLGPRAAFTYDSMGRLASATDPAGTTTYAYDLRGWLVAATRGARTRQWQYDADGHVTNFVSPLGHAVAVRRNALGAPTEVADPLGRTNRYVYDDMNRIVSATDPLGRTVGYGYDEGGRLASITNPLGADAAALYDADGRVQFQTDFDGYLWTFAYTPMGRLALAIGPMLNATQYAYDEAGRLAETILPDDTREAWTYDALDNVAVFADRATNAWTFGYDALGRLVAATNPAGGVVRTAYNLDGTIASIADSDSGPVSNRYDAARRLVQTVLPGGAATDYAYNEHDEIVSVADENGNTIAFEYDADGRLVAETDPAGRIARFAYDAAGQLTGAVDRAGGIYSYGYDAAGQLVRETDPAGVETAYAYDAAGRLVETAVAGRAWRIGYDASGAITNYAAPSGRSSSFVLDALHHPIEQIDPLGRSTVIERDELRRITCVRDPLGRENTFAYESRGLVAKAGGTGLNDARYEYDALGNLARIADPGGHDWTFGRSPMGALRFLADPLGRTNGFAYDALGQIVRTDFPDGTHADVAYDPAGNATGVVHSTGESFRYDFDTSGRPIATDGLALAYDPEGRITNTIAAADGRAFSAAYDAAGRIVSASYDGGTFFVYYSYDPQTGLLTNAIDTLCGASVSFSYDDDFRLIGLARGNGVHTTYEYDDADRLVRIAHGSIADLTYEYDAADRVVRAAGTVPVGGFGGVETAAAEAAYDAASQMASPGFSCDPRGRVANAPGHAYVWDGASRLVGADGVALAYDGEDNLIARAQAGTTTRLYYNFALGATPIVAERDETMGVFTRFYVWEPGGTLLYLIDVAAGLAPRYYHFDRVGSTLALTDGTGAATDAYAYDPYGRILGRLGASEQPFTFVGAHGVRREAENLYQMGARYYDAAWGRFLSPDPRWPTPNPRDLNPYAYAQNNPLLFIDPAGTVPFKPLLPPGAPIPAIDAVSPDLKNIFILNWQEIRNAKAAQALWDKENVLGHRKMMAQSRAIFAQANFGARMARNVLRLGLFNLAGEALHEVEWKLLELDGHWRQKAFRDFRDRLKQQREARRRRAEAEAQRRIDKWWREGGQEATDRFLRERALRHRDRITRTYRRPDFSNVAPPPAPHPPNAASPVADAFHFPAERGMWSVRGLDVRVADSGAPIPAPAPHAESEIVPDRNMWAGPGSTANTAYPVATPQLPSPDANPRVGVPVERGMWSAHGITDNVWSATSPGSIPTPSARCHQQPRNVSPGSNAAARDFFNCGIFGDLVSRHFVQDTLSVGNLTVPIGIRYDKEGSPPPYATVPAPPPLTPSPAEPNAQFPVLMDPRIFRLGAKVEF